MATSLIQTKSGIGKESTKMCRVQAKMGISYLMHFLATNCWCGWGRGVFLTFTLSSRNFFVSYCDDCVRKRRWRERATYWLRGNLRKLRKFCWKRKPCSSKWGLVHLRGLQHKCWPSTFYSFPRFISPFFLGSLKLGCLTALKGSIVPCVLNTCSAINKNNTFTFKSLWNSVQTIWYIIQIIRITKVLIGQKTDLLQLKYYLLKLLFFVWCTKKPQQSLKILLISKS